VLKFPPFAIHGSGISSDDGNEETADSEQDFEIEADIILPDEVDQIDRDMTEETEPDVDNGDNAGEAE
jgi:hypothetical protein